MPGLRSCCKVALDPDELLHWCRLLTRALRCRKPVKEFLDAVRAVKSSDLAELVSKMIKTPLSMACLGDIASVPRYNDVQSRFK